MRKLLIATTAFAIVGSVALKPTPANAVAIFLPFVLAAKEDKNFKAVNPYAKPVKVKKSKKKR